MTRLADLLARQGAGAGGPADLAIDGILMPAAATQGLIEQLDGAGPFGAAAPAPRFAFPAMTIRAPRRIGETHLRLTLADGTHSLEAIAFGAFDGPLGPALMAAQGRFHLAGRMEINHFNGRSKPQLRLEDAARSTD